MKHIKLKLILFIVFAGFTINVNAQVAHPPQNRGADGMYYWNESLQKYVKPGEAQINYNQYYSVFPNGKIDVLNYLTGKTFTKKPNGTGEDYTNMYFVGMDTASDKPFDYNPYPNAKDYAGAPWDFPQNRLRMILRNDNNNVDTFFIWQVEFQQNGAAVLSYFRKGENFANNTVAQEGYISTSKFYLFKQNANENRGIEAYLGGLPNGMYRIENDFVYDVKSQSNSTSTVKATNKVTGDIPFYKTEKYKKKTTGGKILKYTWEILKALLMALGQATQKV
jgi:hypothetical protein